MALQGVFVGISGAILYAPIVIWVCSLSHMQTSVTEIRLQLSEWFVERRALAGSLIFVSEACAVCLILQLLSVHNPAREDRASVRLDCNGVFF